MNCTSIILILICLCGDNTSKRTRFGRSGNITACDNISCCEASNLCSSESVCQEAIATAIDPVLNPDFNSGLDSRLDSRLDSGLDSRSDSGFDSRSDSGFDSAFTPGFEAVPTSAFETDVRPNYRRSNRVPNNTLNKLEPHFKEDLQTRVDVNSITRSSGSITISGNSNPEKCETDYPPETINNQEPSPIDGDIRQSQNTRGSSKSNRTDRANRSFIRTMR